MLRNGKGFRMNNKTAASEGPLCIDGRPAKYYTSNNLTFEEWKK